MSEQIATAEPLLADGRLRFQLAAPASAAPRSSGDAAWPLVRAIVDAAMLSLATVAGQAQLATAVAPVWQSVLTAVVLVGFAATGAYRPYLRLPLEQELRGVLAGSGVAVLAVAAAVTVTGEGVGAGDVLVRQWLLAAALLVAGRTGVLGAQRLARTRLHGGRRTLIVGAGRVGQLTAKRLFDEPHLGLRPIGFLDKDPLDAAESPMAALRSVPVLGASWDLERVVRTHGVEHVVIAFSTAPHHVLLRIVRECWRLGVTVSLVPRLFEVQGQRFEMEHLGALPLIGLRASNPRGAQFAVKYAVDRVVAGLALLALAPLMALIALAVRVTMGGPVLFRQERVGRDGRVFGMLKFRTMRTGGGPARENDADWAATVLNGGDGSAPAQSEPVVDDRRTPLGRVLRKLSLDELPQIYNVLRGDMSLIGPRPERVAYVAQFADVIYRYPERQRVKSGLTGWAQVHGLRGETSLTDRIEWDNFYIENWSPWLDLKIIAMTVPALFGLRSGQ